MEKASLLTISPSDRDIYPNLKSRTELKRIRLMPKDTAEAKALVIRKLYGNYYLYDISEAVPYKETEEEKNKRLSRRSRLSCKRCNKYLGRLYKEETDKDGYCYQCKEDMLSLWMKEQRKLRRARLDSLRRCDKKDVIYLDTETTGLNPLVDELLQVAIIRGDGRELFNAYIKPTMTTSWDAAMEVNGITPDMVKDEPTISDYRFQIQNILSQAKILICYNNSFDIGFLTAAGLNTKHLDTMDAMIEFAEGYGEWNYKTGTYRYKTLIFAAGHYGYEYTAHDAMEDAKATKYIMEKMIEEKDSL